MGLKLQINNSTCQLSGLTREQFQAVRQVLSYVETKRNRFGFANVTRYLISKYGEFPTGLLQSVLAWAETSNVHMVLQDTRIVPDRSPGMFTLLLGGRTP